MDTIKKILMTKEGRKFYVRDTSKDFHTQYGFVKAKDLKKKSGIVKTNTKQELALFESSFIDSYSRIKRMPQIISLKDIGLIIAETGINKKSRVLDAGSGSGALACFLAGIAKEVVTYEIRDDFRKVVEENIKFLNLKNIKIKKKDIYEGIDDKDLDVIIFDLPEPWQAIDSAKKGLKTGGFLVSYSPSIPQAMDFVNAIRKEDAFMHLRTLELIQRSWEIEDRKVRPKTKGIGHTGFLSFCRRIM